MISNIKKQQYYQALINKDSNYDGLFFVGVKTTGVFCSPTCTARKPKFENCEFFTTAEQALLASFRPCKRCQPLSHPNQMSSVVQKLVKAVEEHPEKRWKDEDFRKLSVDVSTARRQFKKRFGMTFVAYARARRMGIALEQIKNGNSIIDTQLAVGYESGSGFRDAFSRIMGEVPTLFNNSHKILNAAWLDTKLGPMLAIADNDALFLLEFVNRRGLEREIERLRYKTKAIIIPGQTKPIELIKLELKKYFNGLLTTFTTPIHLLGSPFQQQVWQELIKIPFGETRSYLDLAITINRPTAFRAVAQANGANQLAIIIPCHRIINSNGNLGGYGGGLLKKQWLLDLERSTIDSKLQINITSK